MKQIIVDKIILDVANDPTNVRIDDERERGELVDSTNSHNSYKKIQNKNPFIGFYSKNIKNTAQKTKQ